MPLDQPNFIVSIYNQKGGIAKTTTSVNMAICLAALGRSVLLVDLDSQGNATKSLGFEGTTPRNLQDLIGGTGSVHDAIAPTRFERLSLMPSSPSLGGIETRLGSELRSQKSLTELIYNSDLPYECVIFDCPPAFGLLSANALVASNSVVIPVTATAFAYDGLQRTFDVVQKIQGGLNRGLRLDGILLTMMEQDNISRHFAGLLRKEYRSYVFDLEIPRDREIVKAALRRLPVCVFNPHALSSQNYLAVTEDFLNRRSARAIGSGVPAVPELQLTREMTIAALERFRDEAASLEQSRPGNTEEARAAEADAAAERRARPLPVALKLSLSHLAAGAAGLALGAYLAPHLVTMASQATALFH